MTSYGFLRRVYSAAAFRIRAKARIARTDRISCFGLSIEVPPTVFHPGIYFSSKALGRYLRSIDLQGRKVLDMGCGAGIQSLVAAARGALATGIDINPLAVESTRANAVRNGLADRVRVYQGDLFTPLENEDLRFDYIIFNPPSIQNIPQMCRSTPGTPEQTTKQSADL